jgi:magnesium chelatase family protein
MCGTAALDRYRARLSGPLLDRIDSQVHVQPVPLEQLRRTGPAEPSRAMRERVVAARDRQRARLRRYGVHCNAEMTARMLRETCPLDDAAEDALAELVEDRRTISARGIDRLIKVARTIADLVGQDAIDRGCLNEAAQFRMADAPADPLVDFEPHPRSSHDPAGPPGLPTAAASGT